jgi:hypothetical protein
MSNRVLDPIDRNSEILFGLFMVLTFTGTLSVTSAGPKEVREMLVAALGCNIAWGLVDGVMFVLRSVVTRARQALLWRQVVASRRPDEAHGLIAQEIGPLSGALFGDYERRFLKRDVQGEIVSLSFNPANWPGCRRRAGAGRDWPPSSMTRSCSTAPPSAT